MSKRPSELADSLAAVATLLGCTTHVLQRLVGEEPSRAQGSEGPLEATVREYVQVLRQIYLEPLTETVQALVLALARDDASTEQALALLRRVMHRVAGGSGYQVTQSSNGSRRAERDESD